MTILFRDIIKSILEQMETQGYKNLCVDLCYQTEDGKVLAYSKNVEKDEVTISDDKGDYLYIRELNTVYKADWNAARDIGACENAAILSNSFRLVFVTNGLLDSINVQNAVYNAFMNVNAPDIENISGIQIYPTKWCHNFQDVFVEETKQNPNSQNLTCIYIDFDIQITVVNCNLPNLKIC